jgi:hypothetical protein
MTRTIPDQVVINIPICSIVMHQQYVTLLQTLRNASALRCNIDEPHGYPEAQKSRAEKLWHVK